MTNTRTRFGLMKALRRARRQAGLSRHDFAATLPTSLQRHAQQQIQGWESGKRLISADVIACYARCAQISPSLLVQYAEHLHHPIQNPLPHDAPEWMRTSPIFHGEHS